MDQQKAHNQARTGIGIAVQMFAIREESERMEYFTLLNQVRAQHVIDDAGDSDNYGTADQHMDLLRLKQIIAGFKDNDHPGKGNQATFHKG